MQFDSHKNTKKKGVVVYIEERKESSSFKSKNFDSKSKSNKIIRLFE